jgi:hypothetical protein
MATAEMFIDYLGKLQAEADNSFSQYKENDCAFPNDALYMVRYSSVTQFAEFVDQMAEKSGKSIGQVLAAIDANFGAVADQFPHASGQIKLLIKQFGAVPVAK